MAKSRRKDQNKVRLNPIAKQVKPPSDPELAAIREQKILPILKDLTSIHLKARSAAAHAITNIIEDTKCRKLLLREKLVTILLEQTITDLNLETKAAGWGVLRNLAIEEEADFCIHLYRLDILTAIEGMIRNIIETVESSDFSTTPKAHKDLVWNMTGSVVTLLSSLAEAQQEIVEAISKLPTLLNFLFGLLGLAELPRAIFEDILTCLTTVTEDNQMICQQIVENGFWFNGLLQLRDGGGMKTVSACSVLHNIFTTMHWFDHKTPVEGASDGNLVPALARCIANVNTPEYQTNGNASHATPDQMLQLALRITASIATVLQENALEEDDKGEFDGFDGFDDDNADEIMEDGSDAGDEGDPDSKATEASGEHEMNKDEMNVDMELMAGSDSGNDSPLDEQLTLNQLVRTAAPIILEYAKPPQDETIEVTETRTNALSALNNISWTFSSIDFTSSNLSNLQTAWAEMASHIWVTAISPVLASSTADVGLASSITSLAYGIARSMQGKVPLQGDEHRKFMALYQASKNLPKAIDEKNAKSSPADEDDIFQGLGVKCIGVLGRLALDPAPIALNRDIGVFLLTSLPDAAAAETVEILNQIFDIYADEESACDEAVFWADGFYGHLEQALPNIRKLIKQIDKRRCEELRVRGDEAVLNLVRFLNYKKQERRKK